MNNQYSKKSTKEHQKNKPWRSILIKKVTLQETQNLIFIYYIVTFSSNLVLKDTAEYIVLIL